MNILTKLLKYKFYYIRNYIKINKSTAYKHAFLAHQNVLQIYDDNIYMFHIDMVVEYARKYQYLLSKDEIKNAIDSAYNHDTIEDCGKTLNDVKSVLGLETAEIVYLLSNNKGRNRKERADAAYYNGIKSNRITVYVKICDRLANIKYSKIINSKMIDMYRSEYHDFKTKLYLPEFDDMFNELESLIKL